ncbi:serine protease [Amnibacterium setariae]|uniref:Serine protease n=1 Tax=Amnibacterium setariae TaxID=2306585 RepID=A0A3A1TWY9_9MICO|nr:serine protease [Amnibacterium setariae]
MTATADTPEVLRRFGCGATPDAVDQSGRTVPTPSRRRALERRLLSIGVGLATATALSLTATAAQADTPSTPVPHSKPTWLSKAKHLGDASSGAKTTAKVYLAPKGGVDALKAAALAVSTPGSASYGKFLTPAQYRSRFAPSAQAVRTVEHYLRAAGLTVTGVESSNRYISVSGDVAAAKKAFAAPIGRYTHGGRTVQAPTTTLKLPTGIAGLVSTITGLDTTPNLAHPAAATPTPPDAGFRNARPASTGYGSLDAKYEADFKTPLPKFQGKTLPYAVSGYTGPLLRAAYEGTKNTLTGSGVTIGIVDAYASPYIAQDASRYAAAHGDAAYRSGQLTQVTPAASKYDLLDECDAGGWYGEETLDVEIAHAMAPASNIRYYGATDCDQGLLDSLAQVVDQDKVDVVSNSWGELGEQDSADAVAAYEQVFLQASLEGISFLFSSGDDGDDVVASGLKQVDYPSSDPYVTAVGGTSDAIDSSGALLGRTGWGTVKESLSTDGRSWTSVGFTSGAGGGSSSLFNKPAYQNGTVGGGARQTPDVGALADPTTGFLVGQTQTFTDGVYYDEYRIGGTSLASPLFAGLTALSIQKAKHDVGLLNPTIYASKGAFTDVTAKFPDAGNVRADYANSENAAKGILYSVRLFDQDSSLPVTAGYDNVTGIGAPNTAWFSAIK